MKLPILRTAVAGFAAGSLCWASWRLIRISRRWGATDSETVRDLLSGVTAPRAEHNVRDLDCGTS
jgi:hypothetical protein